MNHDIKIKLHKEQLDILKRRVKTAAVTIHKEVITEEKTIVVPVTREELVIEKKVFNAENPNSPLGHSNIIRVPLCEERIEIVKHPVVLEEVTIYKQRFQKVEHVERTLKKEIVHLGIIGNAKFVDNNSKSILDSPESPNNQK